MKPDSDAFLLSGSALCFLWAWWLPFWVWHVVSPTQDDWYLMPLFMTLLAVWAFFSAASVGSFITLMKKRD